MGVKRRAFLFGGAAVIGGGIFVLNRNYESSSAQAEMLTQKSNENSFSGWLKIAGDETITVYSPHIDFGQGTHTALAQMLAEELDANWQNVRVEQAPAESAFANSSLVRASIAEFVDLPDFLTRLLVPTTAQLARTLGLQITAGSTAIRMTGQHGMRVLGAAVRLALLEAAAAKFGVMATELSTSDGMIAHLESGKTATYGALAADAATRSLTSTPALKNSADFKIIGTSRQRLDIPKKVTGEAIYGIDFTLPEMRIATLMAAPVRGGKLLSVATAPALEITGVEMVIRLEDAIAVIATGYWHAIQGLRALAPRFSDGGFGDVSNASIFEQQDALITGENQQASASSKISATYRVPFLHHATMEPPAISAHYSNGKIRVWGGLQDPLETRAIIAEVSGVAYENVIFNPMIMGGSFGRRFPQSSQFIGQAVKLAMQLPYPIKLIWSREEDVAQGAYRPQLSAHFSGTLNAEGNIASWSNDYAQNGESSAAAAIPYSVATQTITHHEYISHQPNAFWRAVDHSQHGFFTESFMDEMAYAAGADPYEFRRIHLVEGSRHQRVLDAVALKASWKTPPAPGVGRGIALVEAMGSFVAQVVEVAINADGSPRVLRVFAVVDCGIVINPKNAEAQVQGAILMGLSAALGEQITLENGAVVQSNFSDYPILQMAGSPIIDVHFIPSEEAPGGLGEPGLPPLAPALANAIFDLSSKRLRQLPVLQHWDKVA
jgi:isoquinoline 1-oxidoreductase subunit beta